MHRALLEHKAHLQRAKKFTRSKTGFFACENEVMRVYDTPGRLAPFPTVSFEFPLNAHNRNSPRFSAPGTPHAHRL